jgi:prepilin-type N-terminal cleavage/methylation domain-containing protein
MATNKNKLRYLFVTAFRFARSGIPEKGFTLVEVVASMAIIAILLTGVLVAYQRTLDAIIRQQLRERGFAVAQRHMETLLATIQEPNSINLPTPDELDPLFTWQLDLQRITLEGAPPEANLGNTVIQATITVECEEVEVEDPPRVELVRYFSTHGLKPIAGRAVAVPITPEYEEPEWYQELRARLGREPTLKETLQHLIETGDLPADVAAELEIFKDEELEDLEALEPGAEEVEELDPCDLLKGLMPNMLENR